MATKIIFSCGECGEQATKWSGKCANCHAWNSLIESSFEKSGLKGVPAKSIQTRKMSLEDSFSRRLKTGIEEFDRVVGGGIVQDALMLLSGEPGIGKSTLALQIALMIAHAGHNVLYISGEESVPQIASRAKRLLPNTLPESFSLISSNHLESIVATLNHNKPDLVVIDSVQTISSDQISGGRGSIAQTRYLAEVFMMLAKQQNLAVLLIGHVNKEGDLAGPKALEHLVDTVLHCEGDAYQELRILRAMKNRFGPTTEIGIFTMTEEGLKEVKNPSEIFLEGRKIGVIGSAISVTLEGSRPLVIEVQALTNHADYNYPKRSASGVDLNRVQLLTAVLNKHGQLKLDQQDVYVNVTGGLRVRDPGIDAAIATAIISSRQDIPLPEGVAVIGEIGLSGEIRPIAQEERRLKELEKLGFKEVWGNLKRSSSATLKIRKVDEVKHLLSFRP